MNTNETIEQLEARLNKLKEEEAAKRKAKELAEREDMIKKQQEADRRVKEAELEKKRNVLESVAAWIKGNARSLDVVAEAKMDERDYQFYSITLSEEGFSYKISISFQNEWSGPRYSGKRDGKLFMKFNNQKFYCKKNVGWSYDLIGEQMVFIFEHKRRENIASNVEAKNRKLVKEKLFPELLKITNATPDEENLEYDWVQERVLGVKIKPTSYDNKQVIFTFSLSRTLSTDEALQLYKELHRIGLVGGSNGSK